MQRALIHTRSRDGRFAAIAIMGLLAVSVVAIAFLWYTTETVEGLLPADATNIQ